jgi:biotin carboxylase
VPERPAALILLGGFAVAWNQRYLRACADRGLRVLIADAGGSHVHGLLRDWREGPEAGTYPAEVALLGAGDPTAIVDRAASWAGQYDIRGVCALREEYVVAAAAVADLFALPSPGLRAATVCRDKYLQRRYLAQWSPRSTLVAPGAREQTAGRWDAFPAVVKPTGRLASSGVRLVTDGAQLWQSLAGYEADETLLFEQCAPGAEFSVESLSHDGDVRYAEVTAKRTTEHNSAFFVEMGHSTPAALAPADRQRLLATHAAVLERLAFGTGMAHAEYRMEPGGDPRLIEIAARPPGDSILALHWLATGSALEEAVVALAAGEDVSVPGPDRHARQVYLPSPQGVLTGVRVDDSLGVPAVTFDPSLLRPQVHGRAGQDPPTVRCVVALKRPGTALGVTRESADRAAMFVIDAPSDTELDALEQRCRAAIAVEVRS